MRISIITPSFNQGHFIEETIRSVQNQDHDDIEHIVMDGGSTDETVKILQSYSHLRWTSGRDGGQSNAINKGFEAATGEIVAWLNSDDMYEPDVLGSVVGYFEDHPECAMLYGDIVFVDRENSLIATYGGDVINYESLIRCPDIVRQPSFFWRRSLVQEIGGVDESLHVVMDFDFLLRAGRRTRFHYLPLVISRYRCYDENKSLSMARRQLKEMIQVYRKNGVRFTRPILRFLAIKYALSFGPVKRLHMRIRGTSSAEGT